MGRAAASDIAHEEAARALDALGADDDRHALPQVGTGQRGTRAQRLRGHGEEDDVGLAERREVICRRDAGVQRDVGKAPGVDPARHHLGDMRGVARPERHGSAGAGGKVGQRRAPGATPENGDVADGVFPLQLDAHLRDADQAVARDEGGECRLAPAVGPGWTHWQHHVAHVGGAVVHPQFDVIGQGEAEFR